MGGCQRCHELTPKHPGQNLYRKQEVGFARWFAPLPIRCQHAAGHHRMPNVDRKETANTEFNADLDKGGSPCSQRFSSTRFGAQLNPENRHTSSASRVERWVIFDPALDFDDPPCIEPDSARSAQGLPAHKEQNSRHLATHSLCPQHGKTVDFVGTLKSSLPGIQLASVSSYTATLTPLRSGSGAGGFRRRTA